MPEQPTEAEILAAVTASGYLMEQEVATILESMDFHVKSSPAYQDPETGKSREIDVIGIKRVAHNEDAKLSAFVEAVCECKNSSAPLVFVGRQMNEIDRGRHPAEYLFPVEVFHKSIPNGYQEVRAFHRLGLADRHYYYQQETKAVQFCRILREGKTWKADHGSIHDALFYPLVKVILGRKQELAETCSPPRPVWLFFPLVVVNSPIYYLDTSDGASQLVETPHVSFVRELKFEGKRNRFAVDFVRKEALSQFLGTTISPFVEAVIRLVEQNPEKLTTVKYSEGD